MVQRIKVRTLGSEEIKEVTLQEAQRMLEDTYNGPVGGVVADGRTGKIIWQMTPDITEIIIIEQIVGGG